MRESSNSQRSSLLALGCALLSFGALVQSAQNLEDRQVPAGEVSAYAPKAVTCPDEPLLRSSRSVAATEQAYATKRKAKADKALAKFLAKKGDFPVLDEYPMVALANAGGGVRGFLTSAGMKLAFDEREGDNYSTAGLLQTFTYETALSGSSIMLGSFVINNNIPSSQLYEKQWKFALENGLFTPGGPEGSGPAYARITRDVSAKFATGVPTSGSDVFSRLFGYTAFPNTKRGPAGVGKKLHQVLNLESSYTEFEAPIPAFVTLGLETIGEGCGLPGKNATSWEFTPFEFGTFDKDIKAHIPLKYLGSTLTNGTPTPPPLPIIGSACVTGFDNANFVIGTSTAIRNQQCGDAGGDQIDNLFSKHDLEIIQQIIDPILGTEAFPFYSLIPNFAYKSPFSPKINQQKILKFIDGGENIQVIPNFPLLYRPKIKVVFMTDSSTYGSGDHKIYLPNGRSLYNTKQQAIVQKVGYRVPEIPKPAKFLAMGLAKRPYFFGCNLTYEDPAFSIVYMPNAVYTYDSAIRTIKNKFTPEESKGLLYNGAQVGTNGNDPDFGFCSGCLTIKRNAEHEGKKLPAKCNRCFKKYCYN